MDARKSVGYWLFYAQRCVGYAFAEVLRARCNAQGKPYEVTPAQFGVLNMLAQEDDQTISTLAQRMALDVPTVSGIVKRLELSGLVQRVHDTRDRRMVKVSMTAEGQEIYQALDQTAHTYNQFLLKHFSEADQQEFLSKLQLLVTNLSEVGMGMGDRFSVLPQHDSLSGSDSEKEKSHEQSC